MGRTRGSGNSGWCRRPFRHPETPLRGLSHSRLRAGGREVLQRSALIGVRGSGHCEPVPAGLQLVVDGADEAPFARCRGEASA